MESIHEVGIVHNDLKLDNLMLDYNVNVKKISKTNDDIFDDLKVKLIDFGFASTFIDQKSKKHIKKSKVPKFCGSMMLSSIN